MTYEQAKKAANEQLYNTIMKWAHKFASIADNSTDGKTIYLCNKMFNHYYDMAREFHWSWIQYKSFH
jgi:hypothetical protein